MRGFSSIPASVLIALLWLPVLVQADTGFTYQGQLQQGGVPYTGNQTLRFRLYDSLDGSIEVATMVEVGDVEVVEGLFQVDLDFGPDVFDGQSRYIEVEVDGQFLHPRQAVSPSPVALYALSGNEGPQGEPGPQGERGDSHWSLNEDATYYMDGRVGIGTNDPVYALEVLSDADTRSIVGVHSAPSGGSFGGWFQSESTSGRGVFGWASSPTGVNYGVRGLTNSSSGSGVFSEATSQTGTTYGVFSQSSSDSGHGVFGRANASSGITYGIRGHVNSPDGYAGFFTGGRNYFEGSVGIGTSDPKAKLHVLGGVRVDNHSQLSTVSISVSGFGPGETLCRTSSGSLRHCGSSRSLKNNISPLEQASELVSSLRPVRFAWNDGGKKDIGLIAEDIAEVIPELATRDDHGNVVGVNYRHMTAVLIGALQDQQTEITSLRAELQAERENTAQRLAALEALVPRR